MSFLDGFPDESTKEEVATTPADMMQQGVQPSISETMGAPAPSQESAPAIPGAIPDGLKDFLPQQPEQAATDQPNLNLGTPVPEASSVAPAALDTTASTMNTQPDVAAYALDGIPTNYPVPEVGLPSTPGTQSLGGITEAAPAALAQEGISATPVVPESDAQATQGITTPATGGVPASPPSGELHYLPENEREAAATQSQPENITTQLNDDGTLATTPLEAPSPMTSTDSTPTTDTSSPLVGSPPDAVTSPDAPTPAEPMLNGTPDYSNISQFPTTASNFSETKAPDEDSSTEKVPVASSENNNVTNLAEYIEKKRAELTTQYQKGMNRLDAAKAALGDPEKLVDLIANSEEAKAA